jgi:hypothetical protein
MMARMQGHRWHNEKLAFWLAPPFSTIPLIPFFSLPSSPLYLGKLMGDPTHPLVWPRLGPWLAALAVVFNGTLLGDVGVLLIAVPLYVLLRTRGRLSVIRVLILFSLVGVLASQCVHLVQNFRQPGLREFAESWLSPLFGCICGLLSGVFFAISADRRFSLTGKALLYSLPVVVLVVCASTLAWSARVWRTH